MTKSELRALVLLRVICNFIAQNNRAPLQREIVAEGRLKSEWLRLGIEDYYPGGAQSIPQMHQAVEVLRASGLLVSGEPGSRLGYDPTDRGCATVPADDNWQEWVFPGGEE